MSNEKDKKKVIKDCLVAVTDIEWWIASGCVSPSVDKLRQVLAAVKRVRHKARTNEVFIYWRANGDFEVTNKKEK